MQELLLVLDLGGTFVFALAGATAAVRRRLDLFGVLFVAFAASTAGGIARDVLIGATPPAAISDQRYLAAAVLAGLVTFRWHLLIERLSHPVRVFDAAGLALFAVAGAEKALLFELNAVMAAVLGMLTAIGGGIVRDVLLAEVPMVLRAEIYAVAALAGAVVVVVGTEVGMSPVTSSIVAVALCFAVRMAAIRLSWRLPRAKPDEHSKPTRNDLDS